MQFNEATNDSGLIQDVDFLCGTTSASYPINDKTRNINNHYNATVVKIWQAVDGWQYDDSNRTDLPIATTTLVDAQQDYELPSTAQRIERVEVLSSNGNYKKIKQIDWHDIGIATSEYLETNGLPLYYDLVGDSIFLYPAPADGYVTLATGLKLYFNREPDQFTTGDTSQEPGIPKAFHRILSLGATIDFVKPGNRRERLVAMKEKLERGLQKFYSKRHIERKSSIRPFDKKRWRQYE